MGGRVGTVVAPNPQDSIRRPLVRLDWLIIVLFGLVFAYQFWMGLARVIDVPAAALRLGAQLNGLGWFLILAGVLVPLVAFVLGLVVSRASTSGRRALILLVALCTSSALLIDICFTIGFGSIIA